MRVGMESRSDNAPSMYVTISYFEPCRCGGRLLLADVGMSSWINGGLAGLTCGLTPGKVSGTSLSIVYRSNEKVDVPLNTDS